jgi:hypothetical protein
MSQLRQPLCETGTRRSRKRHALPSRCSGSRTPTTRPGRPAGPRAERPQRQPLDREASTAGDPERAPGLQRPRRSPAAALSPACRLAGSGKHLPRARTSAGTRNPAVRTIFTMVSAQDTARVTQAEAPAASGHFTALRGPCLAGSRRAAGSITHSGVERDCRDNSGFVAVVGGEIGGDHVEEPGHVQGLGQIVGRSELLDAF